MYIKKTPLLHPSDHTYPISTYRAHTPLLHYLHWTASLRRRVLLHRCTHITYHRCCPAGIVAFGALTGPVLSHRQHRTQALPDTRSDSLALRYDVSTRAMLLALAVLTFNSSLAVEKLLKGQAFQKGFDTKQLVACDSLRVITPLSLCVSLWQSSSARVGARRLGLRGVAHHQCGSDAHRNHRCGSDAHQKARGVDQEAAVCS